MAKNTLRKIKIANETFLWKRSHAHLVDFKLSKCVEKLVIYLEGFKKSPLQLLFREEDNLTLQSDIRKEKWCVGYPNEGVIWLFRQNEAGVREKISIHINLNRPAVIACFIQYFYHKTWKPKEMTQPLVIHDALKLLEVLELPVGI